MNQPLFSAVHAGAPRPIDERAEIFDLAAYLIRNPSQTAYIRVSGDSMQDLGIFDGDILIVDNELTPEPLNVVIAEVDGEYTVKQFRREPGRLKLVPANAAYREIDITEQTRLIGVARFAIHRL